MSDKPRVQKMEPRDFDACEACGYDGGFHVVLRHAQMGAGPQELAMLLKCPGCKAEYNVGLAAKHLENWR